METYTDEKGKTMVVEPPHEKPKEIMCSKCKEKEACWHTTDRMKKFRNICNDCAVHFYGTYPTKHSRWKYEPLVPQNPVEPIKSVKTDCCDLCRSRKVAWRNRETGVLLDQKCYESRVKGERIEYLYYPFTLPRLTIEEKLHLAKTLVTYSLDAFGSDHDLLRTKGESDDSFRSRIIRYLHVSQTTIPDVDLTTPIGMCTHATTGTPKEDFAFGEPYEWVEYKPQSAMHHCIKCNTGVGVGGIIWSKNEKGEACNGPYLCSDCHSSYVLKEQEEKPVEEKKPVHEITHSAILEFSNYKGEKEVITIPPPVTSGWEKEVIIDEWIERDIHDPGPSVFNAGKSTGIAIVDIASCPEEIWHPITHLEGKLILSEYLLRIWKQRPRVIELVRYRRRLDV